MTEGEASDRVSLPTYEVGQVYVRDDDLDAENRRRLRDEYGYIRAFFKMRGERHRDLQRWLNQSRNGQTFDEYLERSLYYSIAVAVGGVLLGALVTLLAAALGVGIVFDPLVEIPVSGGLAAWYQANQTLFVVLQVAPVVAVVSGGATWLARYYYPLVVVNNRQRNIAFMLPNAIIMMYALSRGGMSLPVIIEKIADAEDAYGEVANEFDVIARDMNLFGSDLYTAVRNARNLTPSVALEQFLDDLINVVESGGDATEFFQEQSKTYLREAQDEQEQFLETLGVLSEIFIVVFVAAPLFLVVILLVISVLGGNQLLQLITIVYAVIPLSMAGYLVLLSTLSEPYVFPETSLDVEEEPTEGYDLAAAKEHPRFSAFQAHKRRLKMAQFVQDPLAALREDPRVSLLVTVPSAIAIAAAFVLTGLVTPSFTAIIERPVPVTTLLFVVPFLVVAVPLSFFHELKRGYEDEIARRFPETLNILSSANNMGVPLADALDIVARWSGGTFAVELRTLRNDVAWSSDLRRSLLRFANRIKVPQVSQTVKLIAEGVGSTRDLSKVLSVAAEDTRNRFRLLKKRRAAMGSYVGVVIIGYLVYLLVIVMLDANFLTPIAELSAQSSGEAPGSPDAPVSFEGIPVSTYRMIFFHSVIIQGIGSGLLTGELASNDVYSGLKYSVLLVLLAVGAFQLV